MKTLLLLYCQLYLCTCFLHSRPRTIPNFPLRATFKSCEEASPALRSEDLDSINTVKKKFFIETHGCQMNLADSDIVRSVLLKAGYEMCDVLEDADLILTNTCAIRENAESKIWQRLKYFSSLRKKAKNSGVRGYPVVGVLGCMAERLKTRLLVEEGVDFVAGPDAYRDLPALLMTATTDQKAANVQLSIEETYSDIQPVRLAEGNTHAFVTITRGCDNHCAFCIVPYTRGRERSRPVESILFEVEMLRQQGYKEIVLLGQNVNSYNYVKHESETSALTGRLNNDNLTPGFLQPGRFSSGSEELIQSGVRFEELLRQVAAIDPEIRIRFQSPHPKDFPDDLLKLIDETPNICNSLHIPAQHGSSKMLDRMRRGYTREAYVSLVKRARSIIGKDVPGAVGLSSDFISGFCGESDEEHAENLSLLKEIGYDQAFTYAYSRREQTYAGLFMKDDVPEDIKSRRLQEMVNIFQSEVLDQNIRNELGRLHIVLIEGYGKDDDKFWTGRTDTNKRVVFSSYLPILDSLSREEAEFFSSMTFQNDQTHGMKDTVKIKALAEQATSDLERNIASYILKQPSSRRSMTVEKGSYVLVKISACRGHTLRAVPIARTTIMQAHHLRLLDLWTKTGDTANL